MRICYDGGSGKTTPYYVEIIANADAKRLTAEVETRLYWDDGKQSRSASREYEISRQRTADVIYGELLGMLDRAGAHPTEREADELHAFVTQACKAVKRA